MKCFRESIAYSVAAICLVSGLQIRYDANYFSHEIKSHPSEAVTVTTHFDPDRFILLSDVGMVLLGFGTLVAAFATCKLIWDVPSDGTQ